MIDVYKKIPAQKNIINLGLYISFFPQLIAGPIVTHDEMIPQLLDGNKKSVNWDNMAKGFYMFAMGLGKKILIADVFGVAVNWGYTQVADLKATNAILVMIA